jgi:hypothetical protein
MRRDVSLFCEAARAIEPPSDVGSAMIQPPKKEEGHLLGGLKLLLVAIPVAMMVVARIVGVVAMMVAIVAMMVAVVPIKVRVPPRWWISSGGRTILSHGYRGSTHQQGGR